MSESVLQPGGEWAEEWVIAEITPFPRPLRPSSPINVNYLTNSFMPASELGELLVDFFAAQYAPAAAQLVLAVINARGAQQRRDRWGRLCWAGVQIVLRSPQEWLVGLEEEDAPPETPELRRMVEELAAEAVRQGWEPAGSGRTWCSLRFRRALQA